MNHEDKVKTLREILAANPQLLRNRTHGRIPPLQLGELVEKIDSHNAVLECHDLPDIAAEAHGDGCEAERFAALMQILIKASRNIPLNADNCHAD